MTWRKRLLNRTRIRVCRLRLILGRRRLLRLTRRKRKLIKQIPMLEDSREMTLIPRELTTVRVPLTLKPETAARYRLMLEDLVILEEQMAERMGILSTICSDSLKRR